MESQTRFQHALRSELSTLQSRNARYSVRAFARRLGLNPGVLSSLLNGKRRVSRRFAAKICSKLTLDPQEITDILTPFYGGVPTSTVVDSYVQLEADQFRLISDWYHFGILSLVRTRGFQSKPAWIAGRLGIPVRDTEQALKRLKRLGLIVYKGKTIHRSEMRVRTTDNVKSGSLRKSHSENLNLAQEALFKISHDKRDYTAVTMAINPQNLEKARVVIRNFQDQISELLEAGDQTEVYKLCIQLFPLTQLGSQT